MEEKIINDGETVLYKTKPSIKNCVLSKLKSYLIYIIMWAIMNGFFVYLILLQNIAKKYWFTGIPILCFDLLGLLIIYSSISKEANRIANMEYILTDKAVYFHDKYNYKQVKRFSFADITRFEKDKDNAHVFYVCIENDYITFEYMEKEDAFYSELAKRVNSI